VVDHTPNQLEFPRDSSVLRSHRLHPHPYVTRPQLVSDVCACTVDTDMRISIAGEEPMFRWTEWGKESTWATKDSRFELIARHPVLAALYSARIFKAYHTALLGWMEHDPALPGSFRTEIEGVYGQVRSCVRWTNPAFAVMSGAADLRSRPLRGPSRRRSEVHCINMSRCTSRTWS
jgi:hypothetical protein